MSSPEVELENETTKVVKFRQEWLRAAGYSKRNAELIASDLDLDWHFAHDLRKKCSDEDLCMRILYG